MKAYFVAYGLPDGFAQFRGDSAGNACGRDASRLGAAYESVDPPAGRPAEYRHLGSLSRSGLPGDDYHRVAADRRNDRIFFYRYRKFRREFRFGTGFNPGLPGQNRCLQAAFERPQLLSLFW